MGWDRALTAKQAITMLETGVYDCVSFDHDLGICEECSKWQDFELNQAYADHETIDESDFVECTHNTGYVVARWLEQRVFDDPSFKVPKMTVHSDNGPGRDAINRAISWIERFTKNRA